METKRRKYSAEFKRESLELWKSSGKSASKIERELGITNGLLAKWRQQSQPAGKEAFPGNGKMTAQDEKIRKLERELAITKQERDILKKAVAIFGKDEQSGMRL